MLAWWLWTLRRRRTSGVQRGSEFAGCREGCARPPWPTGPGGWGASPSRFAKPPMSIAPRSIRRWPSQERAAVGLLEPGLDVRPRSRYRFTGTAICAFDAHDRADCGLVPRGRRPPRGPIDVGRTKELVDAVNDRALGGISSSPRSRPCARRGGQPLHRSVRTWRSFGVVLWGEPARARRPRGCRRLLRFVLAPLAGSNPRPTWPRSST